MRQAFAGSRAFIVVGMILSLGLLAACGGDGSSSTSSASDPASAGSGASTSANAQTSGAQTVGSDTTSSSDPSPVQADQSGAVTLSWQPPTENTDGTALTDLSGYTIHYGTHSGDYTSSVQLTNPGLTTYVMDNLTPGTYYFAITASANNGAQSDYSPEVTAIVN